MEISSAVLLFTGGPTRFRTIAHHPLQCRRLYSVGAKKQQPKHYLSTPVDVKTASATSPVCYNNKATMPSTRRSATPASLVARFDIHSRRHYQRVQI